MTTYRPLDVSAIRAAMPDVLLRGERAASGCLLWPGYTTHNGYGQARIGGQVVYVHRAAWVAANGEDPGPLQIDHLCRVRACYDPEHLEAVTASVNVQRSRADSCLRGHQWDEANTLWYKGRRFCRACRRTRDKGRVR